MYIALCQTVQINNVYVQQMTVSIEKHAGCGTEFQENLPMWVVSVRQLGRRKFSVAELPGIREIIALTEN